MVRAAVPAVGFLLVLLTPVDIDRHARSALAIAVAMVLAWLVESLHPGLVGFIGAFLFVATAGVDFESAFAGFATTTPWFLYGALLLFTAAMRAGIVDFVRAWSPPLLTRSPTTAAGVLIVIAYLIAFLVPSSIAKATILVLLAVAWSSSIVPLLAAGYAAVAFGHADMPGGPGVIIGWDAAVSIALFSAALLLSRSTATTEPQSPAAARGCDWKIALIVLVAVSLWLTAPLHRATPDLVGLAAGLACWLPGIAGRGVQDKVTADPLALIFAGTALSIPAVLLETKAAESLLRLWLTMNESAGMLPQTLAAYWSTVLYRLFSPDAAYTALPVLDGNATPLGTAATWAYAGSTLIAPQQSPALVLAMSIGGVRAWHVLMVGLFVLVAGSIVVILGGS